MAAISPSSRPATKAYRRYALIWLLMTLLLGVVTALVWMFAKTPAAHAQIENEPITANASAASDIVQPTKIESLHELDADVQPIDFSAMVRDLRDYPDEFKDKSFLIANKGKWTVQVMNVAENDVIVDYLLGREDRSKFAYFRYRDDNNQLRYMLTYGIMSSAQEANGAAKLIDFGLPPNVRVIPEEFNRYVNIIDSYELAAPVVDLDTKRNRKVNLQPTRREVPVRRRATPTSSQDNNESNNDLSNSSADNSTNSRSDNDQVSASANNNQSIRQSEDASKTLVVNEQRVVNDDTSRSDSSSSQSTVDNSGGSSANNKATDKKSTADSSVANKKEPAPKAESNNKNQAKGGNNKESNNNAAATGTDPIKALIEEKSN